MTKEEINGYSCRIAQASRTELIVILYEMTIDYLNDGLEAFSINNIEDYRLYLKKAQRVVNELSSVLDMQYQISAELLSLYLYMNKTIVKCSIRKEIEEITIIINMLKSLKKAFEEVSKTDKSGPLMENTQKVYAGLTYSNGGTNQIYNYESSNRGFIV